MADNPHFDVTSHAFAAALIQKGVVSTTLDRRFEVAIPSMAERAEGSED